ncbi:MAG TPA: CopG family transcriptional regulator [Mycobacterium sp.]|nr:CopG family transcriptional regulator [Mycobacterium sp.]
MIQPVGGPRIPHRDGLGVSEALNLLARRGMAAQGRAEAAGYRHRTARIGLKVDVTNVVEVLDLPDDDH